MGEKIDLILIEKYANCYFSLVEENSNTVMPIIFLPLYEAAKTHWNSTIVMLVCNVLKTLMEINQVSTNS